jgi:hypothetical protein
MSEQKSKAAAPVASIGERVSGVSDFLINQVKKVIGDKIIAPNALDLIHRAVDGVGRLALGTTWTQVDDVLFQEIIVDHEADIDSWTVRAVEWVRNELGLDPEPGRRRMFGAPMNRSNNRGLFYSISRARLVNELAADPRNAGMSRRNIRRKVDEIYTDDRLDFEAKTRGVPMRAIGDGSILSWLWDHSDEIAAWILRILPLFFMVVQPKMAAAGKPVPFSIIPSRTPAADGIWSDTYDGGDIHVYTDPDGVTIGHNDKELKAGKKNFSPLCIRFRTDGKLIVQYDDKGKCVQKPLGIEVVQAGLMSLLNDAVDSVS